MKLFKRSVWNQIKPEDKWETACVFCDVVSEWEKELIIWRGNFFYIKHNKFPYLWLSNHLLVIPYRHVEHTKDLSVEEFQEFKEVEKFMFEYFGWEKYFSFIRQSGEAKSLHHLHYHYLPGEMLETAIENMLLTQWIERIERPEYHIS